MKNTYLFILLFVSLFYSCKKDNDTYYIRCNIDGTARTFTSLSYAHKESQNGITAIGMGAFASSDTEGDWFGFYIDNSPGGDEIVAGTYDHTSADFDLLATHSNEGAGFDYGSGSTIDEDAVTYGVTIANHFRLVIQSIDGNTIKGTFSGDFYADHDPRNAKKSVTNGEFNLKFK